MYLHNGGAVNCGGPICLSMLAGRQAADKEGLNRLFNSGIIFPPPSGSQEGEKNEKKEEQEKKGSGGEENSDAQENKEKESPDPGNKNPEEDDKPLEEGAAKTEDDGKKSKQSGADKNSHEEEVKRPNTTPIYAACWSTGAYRPGFFEEINKRWWSSSSDVLSNPLWPTYFTSCRAIPELVAHLTSDEGIRNTLISAKADEMLRQDPDYIKLEKAEKKLRDTPGSKFLTNVLGEFGVGGNLALDNASSGINSLNKQFIEKEKKRIEIYYHNQAEKWCQETSWCRIINNQPERTGKKNNLFVQGLAKEITDNRIKKGIYIDKNWNSQEDYSRPSCLLKPVRKILSSSVTDSVIKVPLSKKFGKLGKILGDGIIYGKDNGVVKIDQSLNKHNKHNLPIDASRAVVIKKWMDECKQVQEAQFDKLINSINSAAESKVTTSNVTNNESSIILPRVSEDLSNSLE